MRLSRFEQSHRRRVPVRKPLDLFAEVARDQTERDPGDEVDDYAKERGRPPRPTGSRGPAVDAGPSGPAETTEPVGDPYADDPAAAAQGGAAAGAVIGTLLGGPIGLVVGAGIGGAAGAAQGAATEPDQEDTGVDPDSAYDPETVARERRRGWNVAVVVLHDEAPGR